MLLPGPGAWRGGGAARRIGPCRASAPVCNSRCMLQRHAQRLHAELVLLIIIRTSVPQPGNAAERRGGCEKPRLYAGVKPRHEREIGRTSPLAGLRVLGGRHLHNGPEAAEKTMKETALASPPPPPKGEPSVALTANRRYAPPRPSTV